MNLSNRVTDSKRNLFFFSLKNKRINLLFTIIGFINSIILFLEIIVIFSRDTYSLFVTQGR